MKIKDELRYFDKEWTEMSIHLNVFFETGDQEALHKFRVEIKKLRAMLTMFGSAARQNGLLKDFKPVKKIFAMAGSIREAYVNLQLGSKYEFKNEMFESSQQRIMEEGTHDFQANGKTFIKTIKEKYKRLKKQMPPVNNSAIAEYYKNQLEQISVNLMVSGFNEDMHTNRKLIKILMYNYKLTAKALSGYFTLNVAYLDRLQNALGQWHDNMVAEQLFSSPELNDKAIVTKIRRKNAGLKRSITILADDFLKKATRVETAETK